MGQVQIQLSLLFRTLWQESVAPSVELVFALWHMFLQHRRFLLSEHMCLAPCAAGSVNALVIIGPLQSLANSCSIWVWTSIQCWLEFHCPSGMWKGWRHVSACFLWRPCQPARAVLRLLGHVVSVADLTCLGRLLTCPLQFCLLCQWWPLCDSLEA